MNLARSARRRPVIFILIAVAMALAATVAFLTYDASRPQALRQAERGELNPPAGMDGPAQPPGR